MSQRMSGEVGAAGAGAAGAAAALRSAPRGGSRRRSPGRRGSRPRCPSRPRRGSRWRGSRRRGRPCSCWRWPCARRAATSSSLSRVRKTWSPSAFARVARSLRAIDERRRPSRACPRRRCAPRSSPPWPGSITTVRRPAGSAACGARRAAGARPPAGRRGCRRRRRGLELEHQPRRLLLLVRLQLLEAPAQRDREHVVASAQELHRVHDAAASAAPAAAHVHEVARDRRPSPALSCCTRNGTFSLASKHHAHRVAR